MKSFLSASLAAAAVALAAATPVSAEEVVINFATVGNPNSPTVKRSWAPWADKLNEAGKGLYKVEMKHGLTIVNHSNYYRRVMDDVVQASFGALANTPGKFPRSEVCGFPFVVDNNKLKAAAVAMWRLYKTGLLDAEYTEIVPALFYVYPQVSIHLRNEPKTIENLEGLKIITTGPVPTEMVKSLGGAPISLMIFEIYEAMQRGTVDGFTMPFPVFPTYKLGNVTKFHINAQMGTNPAFVMFARKKFDGYSQEVRKALEKNFGEAPSAFVGGFYGESEDEGRKMVENMKQPVIDPPKELVAKWQPKVQPVIDQFVKETPNGKQIWETWQKLLKEAEAEYKG